MAKSAAEAGLEFPIGALARESGVNIETVRYYEKQVSLDEVLGDMEADAIETISDEEGEINVVDLEKGAGEAPVIKLCNVILLNAIKKRASVRITVDQAESFQVADFSNPIRLLRRSSLFFSCSFLVGVLASWRGPSRHLE